MARQTSSATYRCRVRSNVAGTLLKLTAALAQSTMQKVRKTFTFGAGPLLVLMFGMTVSLTAYSAQTTATATKGSCTCCRTTQKIPATVGFWRGLVVYGEDSVEY